MAADFVVDYGLLQQTEKALTSLKSEFSNVNAVPKTANWGSGDVSSAMGGFAGNWSDHRGNLLKSLDAMIKNVQQTMTETQQYDTDYARELTR